MAANPTVAVNGHDVVVEGADYAGLSLVKANFSSAKLKGACLDEADLSGANLNSADLSGATFRRAVLEGTNFHNAVLDGATFEDVRKSANLDLSYARLNGVWAEDVNLERANLAAAHGTH